MGRILCIDYGLKRTGIAVTDPLQIIASALTTLETPQLLDFLKQYCATEPVERILLGEPLDLDDRPTHATGLVRKARALIEKALPQIPIEYVDERYTSKRAVEAMVQMGMKKKDRRVKGNVDKLAATIMLQTWLQERGG